MSVHPFTVVLGGVAATFAVQTLALGAGARRVPLAVVVPLVALIVWQLVREARGAPEPVAGDPQAQVLRAIGWTLLLPLSILVLGMIAGPPLFVLAYQRIRGGEPWRPALAIAGVVAVLLWVLLEVLLTVSVPWGVLAPLAGR